MGGSHLVVSNPVAFKLAVMRHFNFLSCSCQLSQCLLGTTGWSHVPMSGLSVWTQRKCMDWAIHGLTICLNFWIQNELGALIQTGDNQFRNNGYFCLGNPWFANSWIAVLSEPTQKCKQNQYWADYSLVPNHIFQGWCLKN